MKFKPCLIFLLFLLFCSSAAAETVRVGYFNKELVIYGGIESKPEGIAADIINEVAEEQDWEIEFVFGTFSEILNLLIDKEIDLMVPLGYTEDRSRIIEYSNETILESWGSVFTLRDSSIKTIADLDSKTIGYVKDSLFKQPFTDLTQEFGITCSMIEIASYKKMFELINSGELSGGIGDRLSYLNYDDGTSRNIDASIAFHPFSLYIGAQKGDPEKLLSHFDKFLKTGKDTTDSRYRQILDKWLSNVTSTETSGVYLVYLTLLILVLISLFFLFSRNPRIQKKLGISRQVKDSAGRNIIIISLALSILLWLLDTVATFNWFNSKNLSFTDILISFKNPHILIERFIYVGTIILAGQITARVFARLALEQYMIKIREEKIRTTLNSIGDAVISTNNEGRIVTMNPVAESLTGWKSSEAEGLKIEEIFKLRNSITNKIVKNPVSIVLETGKTVSLKNHTVLTSKSGEEKHIADSAAPIYSDEGEFGGVVLVFRDISEEYLLQEQLKRNVNFTESLLDSIPTAVFYKDIDGYYRGCNQVFSEFFGIDSNDLDGKTVYDLWPEELAEVYESKDNELLQKPERQIYEYQIKDKSGQLKPVLYAKSVYYDQNDNVAGIVGSFVDISERKKAEENLRQLQHYLSNIIDSMPSMLIGLDLDGKITQWNLKAETQTGKSNAEALGKNLETIIPRFSGKIQLVKDAVSAREVKKETRNVHQEKGREIYENITIYPLIADGVEGAVIQVEDVTEQVKIEELIIQSEKMLSVGGLAAGMAHEINNPLAGMIQTADVMKNRLIGDLETSRKAAEEAGITLKQIEEFMNKRKIPEMIMRIKTSGERASMVIQNMLSFARKSDSQRSTHDLTKLMDDTIELAKNDYDLKKMYDFRLINIIKNYEPDIPELPCAASKIQQVFFNLLRNSAEAMQEPARGTAPEENQLIINISYKKDKGFIQVEIEDNGPGMEEEVRKRVFEPFFTTKPPDRGTGLGLSVSYFIITENHNGEMSVASTPGMGTKFTISLPVSKETLNGKKNTGH